MRWTRWWTLLWWTEQKKERDRNFFQKSTGSGSGAGRSLRTVRNVNVITFMGSQKKEAFNFIYCVHFDADIADFFCVDIDSLFILEKRQKLARTVGIMMLMMMIIIIILPLSCIGLFSPHFWRRSFYSDAVDPGQNQELHRLDHIRVILFIFIND